MLFQLPSGKTIRITEEQFFKMSDDEIQELNADDIGHVVENPFYDSCLAQRDEVADLDEFELPEDIEELPEGFEEED
jgi:hypothetical protein